MPDNTRKAAEMAALVEAYGKAERDLSKAADRAGPDEYDHCIRVCSAAKQHLLTALQASATRPAADPDGQSEAVRQIREHDIRADEATMRGGHKCGWPDCGCDHDAVCFEALEAAREPLRVASTFSSRSGEMAAAALRKVEAALTSPARARGEG